MDLSGDVALQASGDLPLGASFGGAAFDIGAGGGVHSHPSEHDGVDRPIQLAVAATIQAVSDGVAREGRNRACTSDLRQRGLGADAARVGPDRDDDRGRDSPDAGHLQQHRCVLSDELCDLDAVGFQLGVEIDHASGVTGGLGPGDAGAEGLFALSPRGHRLDLPQRECLAGVHAQVVGAQQRSERIDRSESLGVHLLPGDSQGLQGCLQFAGAPVPQPIDVHHQC